MPRPCMRQIWLGYIIYRQSQRLAMMDPMPNTRELQKYCEFRPKGRMMHLALADKELTQRISQWVYLPRQSQKMHRVSPQYHLLRVETSEYSGWRQVLKPISSCLWLRYWRCLDLASFRCPSGQKAAPRYYLQCTLSSFRA